jgi:fatty acid desaturase
MIKAKTYFSSEEVRPLAERSNLAGLFLVLHCYGTMALSLILFSIWSNVFTFIFAVMIIGSRQLGLAILMHDSAHRALFANRRLNEDIGFWVCGSPILADMRSYRHYHLIHHKHTQSEKDPDRILSQPFPTTYKSLFRKVLRDISGQTGIKSVFKQVKTSFILAFDDEAIESFTEQAQTFKGNSLSQPIIANFFIFLFMWIFGAWWWWLAFWLLPLITWFQVVIRIRNVAEHAATDFSDNELQNVRTTYANPLMRLFIAPYWVNYHLEHHLIMHVPCWSLPKVHQLMLQKGYAKKMRLAKNYLHVLKEVTIKPA